MNQIDKIWVQNSLARKGDNNGAVSMLLDIRRRKAKPVDKVSWNLLQNLSPVGLLSPNIVIHKNGRAIVAEQIF